MKSKKLGVFLGVLIFILVLIVLNSTLFTLQSVNIYWLTNKNVLELEKDNSITNNIKTGDSIFLIKKDEIKDSLEKKYPYLRVVSIETKFPNRLVIHSAEREALYAVKIYDDNYAIIDDLGKVLKINSTGIDIDEPNIELRAIPIKVYFNKNTLSINPESFKEGELVDNETIVNLLSKLAYSLKESGYDSRASKRNLLGIDVILVENSVNIYITTSYGMRIVLKDGLKDTTDKILLGLTTYNNLRQKGYSEGDIIVWYENTQKEIISRYEKSNI